MNSFKSHLIAGYNRGLFLSIIFGLSFFNTCNAVRSKNYTNSYERYSTSKKPVTLIVRREKNLFIGRLCKFIIYVNEIPIGTIDNGEEKTFKFNATKSGYSVIKIESATIALSAVVNGLIKHDMGDEFRKEVRVSAKSGTTVAVFCSFKENGIYLKKLEI